MNFHGFSMAIQCIFNGFHYFYWFLTISCVFINVFNDFQGFWMVSQLLYNDTLSLTPLPPSPFPHVFQMFLLAGMQPPPKLLCELLCEGFVCALWGLFESPGPAHRHPKPTHGEVRFWRFLDIKRAFSRTRACPQTPKAEARPLRKDLCSQRWETKRARLVNTRVLHKARPQSNKALACVAFWCSLSRFVFALWGCFLIFFCNSL